MIIKRNVNVLIPNDKVIRKLKIQKNQNIIYEEVNGVITFIGTKKESDEICWHDLYTGHKTKDKMNVVRIQSARDKEIRHLCNYMYVEDVLYSDVILLNVDKIKILSSNFDVMMFIITQKAGVEAIDKYYNP
ncbi:MAG: hypothetical protein J6L69_10030, partial [Lachnospiraceae bacterium]|nr:hypothetical protein [Lachnospiraceae bacterium]